MFAKDCLFVIIDNHEELGGVWGELGDMLQSTVSELENVADVGIVMTSRLANSPSRGESGKIPDLFRRCPPTANRHDLRTVFLSVVARCLLGPADNIAVVLITSGSSLVETEAFSDRQRMLEYAGPVHRVLCEKVNLICLLTTHPEEASVENLKERLLYIVDRLRDGVIGREGGGEENVN